MKTLYTAEAVVEGGRQGHGRTSDGRLDVDLSVPMEMSGAGGPGTNPEQLFAIGYAACFQSTLTGVARGRKLDVSESRITSRVGIGPTGHGGFTLSVSLDLHTPQLSPSVVRKCVRELGTRHSGRPSGGECWSHLALVHRSGGSPRHTSEWC